MKIHLIVAMTRKGVIGAKGSIPWDLPGERRLFRRLTLGKTVIMGKNTWDSLPDNHRPLPGRRNIVVSAVLGRQKGAMVCRTLEEALENARESGKDIYCIGGAKLYKQALPLADALDVSWVQEAAKGDVFFPRVDWELWRCSLTKRHPGFTYKRYERKAGKKPL